eukprot:1316543-Amorphochlora_amoeboformis.AAC.1
MVPTVVVPPLSHPPGEDLKKIPEKSRRSLTSNSRILASNGVQTDLSRGFASSARSVRGREREEREGRERDRQEEEI